MINGIGSHKTDHGDRPPGTTISRPGKPGASVKPGAPTRTNAPGAPILPGGATRPAAPGAPSPTFREALQKETLTRKDPAGAKADVKLSAHAERRLKERNIELGVSDLLVIDKALKQAAAKGSRESLLVYGDIALVTSVKNKTIVTAMEKEEASGRIFTNIDSTVLIDRK